MKADCRYATLLREFRKKIIEDELKAHEGKRASAARALGISPRLMYYYIAELKIDVKALRAEQIETGVA